MGILICQYKDPYKPTSLKTQVQLKVFHASLKQTLRSGLKKYITSKHSYIWNSGKGLRLHYMYIIYMICI